MAFRRLWSSTGNQKLDDYLHELNRRIKQAIDGGGGGAVTWQNFVFVGKDGNDGTGVRNSLSNKFLTIQAALNIAQAGDVIFVGPGVYQENLVWPDTDNLTLTSMQFGTAIEGPALADLPVIGKSGTYNLQGAYIVGLQIIQQGPTAPAIYFNGTGVANYTMFTTVPLIINECLCFVPNPAVNSLHLNTTGETTVRNSSLRNARFEQIDHVGMTLVNVEGTIEHYYDVAVNHPPSAEGVVEIHDSEIDNMYFHKHAKVRAYRAEFAQIQSLDLEDTDTPGPWIGEIYMEHCAWDELELQGAFAFVIPAGVCEAFNCHSGDSTIIRNGGGELRPRAMFRNTDFNTLVSDDAEIDANECHLNQGLTSGPNGGLIDRTIWYLGPVVAAPSPGAPYAGPWIPYINAGLTASAAVVSPPLSAVEFPGGVGPFGFTIGGSTAGVPGPVGAEITILQTK